MTDIDLLSLTSTQGFKISGAAAGDLTGASVSNVGDINGDGITDLVVGALYADPSGRSNAGAAYVIYGKSSGLTDIDLLSFSASDGIKISGAAAGDNTGASVSNVGDINGDGVADLVVSAHNADPSGRSNAGGAYVIYGKSSGLTDIDLSSFSASDGIKISGAVAGDLTGSSVSNAGDINGDGTADIVVGADAADPSGRTDAGVAYVIYGKSSGLTDIDLLSFSAADGIKISGAAAGDITSRSVTSAGDINGDGIADLVVSARNADPSGRSNAGAAYVIYGKSSGLADIDLLSFSAADGIKISGAAAGDNTGYSVSYAGDINGDGVADLLVGADAADPSGRTNAGAAYVIYGKSSGLTDIDLLSFSAADGIKISGAAAADGTGLSVSNVGDINGDGIADIVVGAYIADPSGRTDAGAAYVIYGKSSGLTDIDLLSFSAADGIKISGAIAGYATGVSVSSAGDVNGDGIADIIVGADAADPSGRSNAGVVYVIYGGQATIVGDSSANTLTGTSGVDIIEGKGGADTIDGGAGTDTASYSSSSAAVTVDLSAGTASGGDAEGDTLTNIENLIGSVNDDTLTGDANANRIFGGIGNDVIEGKAGADTIDGGAGTNTASYSSSSAGVTVDLSAGTASGGDAASDVLTNIQNLIGSANDDTLTGDANANVIEGGAGADTINGGTGTNTASYSSSSAAVTVDLSAGTASGGDAAGDVLTNIQNLIGSANADTLTGDANANNIQGGAGNDIIEGKAGADTIDGGAGTNTASYSSSSAAVTVDLSAGTASGGDAAGDVLTNIQNLIGSANADTLTGDANTNVIEGGAGADTINGGTGTNTASYSSSSAAVTVDLSAGTASGGDAAGDVLTNIQNLIGSANADTLTGDANANNIQGGAGSDILTAVGSGDTLTGGSGIDSFKLSSDVTTLTVTDFDYSNETIDLTQFSSIDYSQLTISDTGTGCQLSFTNSQGNSVAIDLTGVSSSNLSASSFVFSDSSSDSGSNANDIIIPVVCSVGGAVTLGTLAYIFRDNIKNLFTSDNKVVDEPHNKPKTDHHESRPGSAEHNSHQSDHGSRPGSAYTESPRDHTPMLKPEHEVIDMSHDHPGHGNHFGHGHDHHPGEHGHAHGHGHPTGSVSEIGASHHHHDL